MIKCNRCGMMNATGAMNCQSCGTPLSSRVDQGMMPQDQPELPAWLGSLRAGERSAPPIPDAANFSAADFVEEGSLPSWMRAERNETRDNTASNPSLGSSPFSGPITSDAISPHGVTARSLVDEQSLPPWMQSSSPMPAVPPADGFAAANLVQQDAVPDWMKQLQQQKASASTSTSGPTASPSRPIEPMSPQLASGFSARDLIDQQSLPAWMAPQNGQGVAQGSSAAPLNNAQAAGFSASSLLDEDALPQWMRESGKGQSVRQGSVPPSPSWQAAQPNQTASQPEMPAWQASQQPNQQPWQDALSSPMQSPSAQGSGLAASSFVDANALPEWLRSANDPRLSPQNNAPRPAGPMVPPHVENVRVPSRPRNEVNSSESSEMAANVFASMLGVAPAAPNYPAPAPNIPYQSPAQMPGGSVAPNTPAGVARPQAQGYAAGSSGVYNGYAPNGQNYQANNQGYQAGNQAYQVNNQGYQANNQGYQAGAPFGGVPPTPGNAARVPAAPGQALATDEQRNAARSTKRNFLDVIRGWFDR